MKTLLSLALRNLGRNRRRTILAASSVFCSILLILFMNGLVEAFMDSMVRNYTKNETGHVSIVTAGYRERERFSPVDDYIAEPGKVEATIASIPSLKGKLSLVAERVRFGTLLSSGPSTKAAVCLAGNPQAERSLAMLDRSLEKGGRYLSGPGEAIVGEGLAKDLGLGLGGTLKVVATKSDTGLGFKRFTVVGIFRTGVNSLDGNLFQIGIADAKELLGMDGAQQLLVMLKKSSDAPSAAAAISAALAEAGIGGLSVLPWTKIGTFPAFIEMANSMYVWMYLIIALLGAFIIANVMMMTVLERKREIGILKSMGMPGRDILALFVLEGSLIGLAGSAAGAAGGLVLDLVMGKVGLDMTSSLKGFSWPLDNVIYPTANPWAALGFVALGTLVAAALSFLPSRSAARMSAVDAIRSN